MTSISFESTVAVLIRELIDKGSKVSLDTVASQIYVASLMNPSKEPGVTDRGRAEAAWRLAKVFFDAAPEEE